MDKSYLCTVCQTFYKTKSELQQHTTTCATPPVIDENGMVMFKSAKQIVDAEMALRLTEMRLSVAILLQKISTPTRLQQLGFEKRLIDNVLIGALKMADQPICEDLSLSETERLRTNVRQFLEWTVPKKLMNKFHQQKKSVEELLSELTDATEKIEELE